MAHREVLEDDLILRMFLASVLKTGGRVELTEAEVFPRYEVGLSISFDPPIGTPCEPAERKVNITCKRKEASDEEL